MLKHDLEKGDFPKRKSPFSFLSAFRSTHFPLRQPHHAGAVIALQDHELQIVQPRQNCRNEKGGEIGKRIVKEKAEQQRPKSAKDDHLMHQLRQAHLARQIPVGVRM